LPFTLLDKILLPDGSKIFLGLGPYLVLNAGGKVKESGIYGNGTSALNIGSNSNDDLKAFDFGINFQAGYELKNGIFIRGNYQLGIANQQPQIATTILPGPGEAASSIKTKNFAITLGYLGGNKKPKKTVPKKYYYMVRSLPM
jgi:hypothetical protein